MGWERKRGKIEELNRLLRGATDTSFDVAVGDPDAARRRPLLHHARLRHPAAARRRQDLDRHHRPSAQPAEHRSAARPRHRGIRHPAAARQRHHGERRGLALRPHLRRPHRRRPLHHRGVGHLPGPLRRRASSPARASTTSTRSWPRSRAACRRTRCSRTISSRASTREPRWSPTSSWSTTIRRACSPTRGGSTAGCAATGRSCAGCSRGCAPARESSSATGFP